MSDSLWPHGLYSPWNSSGQNTGVGSLSLLQGIFPTQGLNPGLPHCRQILYQLSHKGSPRTLEWVAYPFSRGSSRPRNQTGVSCIAGGFFSNWAIREAWGRNGEYLRARSSGVMGITSAVLNGTLSSLCVGELMPFKISPPLFLFLNGAENFLCSRLQFFIMINYSSRTA